MADCVVIQAVAGADLSAKKGLFVYSDGSDTEHVKVSGDAGNGTVLGILLNAPADDGIAEICIEGFCNAVAGEALEPFDYLTSNSNGAARVVDTSNDYILARYVPPLENGAPRDAASGDIVRVQVLQSKLTLHP